MRLAVAGWPVGHSRSPAMHNAALAAAGLKDWHYGRLPVPPALFAETVSALPALGFRGLNVTIPHKTAALALARAWPAGAHISRRAAAIGAVNTLVFAPDGTLSAENTDAPALQTALPAPVAGRVALVLGAGGSARAAVWALLDAGAHVRVWNRTTQRARALCRELGAEPVAALQPADLLVNCTSVGLVEAADERSRLPIGEVTDYGVIADFVYRPRGTALTRDAERAGVRVIDGLELLARQGALSFTAFTSLPAPLALMLRAARAQAT